MTGKEYLQEVSDLCHKCREAAENFQEGGQKEEFKVMLEKQQSVIESMMERVFFKTPKGINSASLVQECAHRLHDSLTAVFRNPETERSKCIEEAEECLREFVERVEGMVLAAQGKTLAFT